MSTSADIPAAGFPSSVGELAELAHLFQQHRERLVSIVRRRIDPPVVRRIDPEGVVSDAFVVAGRRWLVFKAGCGGVSEFVWLYRIVIDEFLDQREKATAGLRDVYREESVRSAVGGWGFLVADGPGPATEAERNDQAAKLAEALGALSRDEQQVLLLRSRDDLTHAEVGQYLGVSEGAAAKRYFRALQVLKREYAKLTGESLP